MKRIQSKENGHISLELTFMNKTFAKFWKPLDGKKNYFTNDNIKDEEFILAIEKIIKLNVPNDDKPIDLENILEYKSKTYYFKDEIFSPFVYSMNSVLIKSEDRKSFLETLHIWSSAITNHILVDKLIISTPNKFLRLKLKENIKNGLKTNYQNGVNMKITEFDGEYIIYFDSKVWTFFSSDSLVPLL